MGRITIAVSEEIEWRRTADIAEEFGFEITEAEKAFSGRTLHPGGPDALQLTETRFPPGAVAEPHAHDMAEIIDVTEGELLFGSRSLGPGSSISVPAFTLYGFRAGPDGLTILGFRPRNGDRYITKAQFLAERLGGDGWSSSLSGAEA